MLMPAITGFVTAFSLILAIGAQNAFVLRQGLLKSHVFPIVLFCALSDAVLITLGVIGFGSIANVWPSFPRYMAWAGAIFLGFYGTSRLWAAHKGDYQMALEGKGVSLWRALAIVAAFTWLNPHVYLDTLGLIGALSIQFPAGAQKWAFGLAAVSASFVFFFSLGYGARLLAPVMQTPRAWQVLDIGIGVVMWALAAGLLISA